MISAVFALPLPAISILKHSCKHIFLPAWLAEISSGHSEDFNPQLPLYLYAHCVRQHMALQWEGRNPESVTIARRRRPAYPYTIDDRWGVGNFISPGGSIPMWRSEWNEPFFLRTLPSPDAIITRPILQPEWIREYVESYRRKM